jgi:hypothetical protein
MSSNDAVQISIVLISFGTLLIVLYQTALQNRLLKAQIIKDRYDMFKGAMSPVSDEEVEMARIYPDNYFDMTTYNEHYKDNPELIKKYLFSWHVYEYMAFRYSIVRLKLPDPIGSNLKVWVLDSIREKEFADVHAYIKTYHPIFGDYVERLRLGKE